MEYEKRADHTGHFLIDRYDAKRRPRYNPIPHFHNSIELLFIESGSYLAYTGGESRVLGARDVVFVDRRVPHTSGSSGEDEGLSVYVMVVSDAYLSAIGWLKSETLPAFSSLGEEGQFIFDFLRCAYKNRESLNDEMRIGYISLILGALTQTVPRIKRSAERENRTILEIMNYISEHFSEDISLEGLASAMGYEATYLSKMFNSFFKMNLREYINRYRISEIMKRQRSDSLPLYKIAEECGYKSENTFYRAYKKYSQEV